MNLTSYIGIGVVILAIGMIFFILKSSENNNNKPHLFSLVAFGIIILNWVLYLFNFYAIIPEKIGDLIFLPVWIIVTVIGFFAAYREFGNNRTFSIVNGGLGIISAVVGMLAWGIGNM